MNFPDAGRPSTGGRAVMNLALLLLALSSTVAARAQSGEREMLLNFLTRFLDAAAHNDPEAHERFWADDLVYTGADGYRYGKTEIMENVSAEGRQAISNDTPIYSAEDLKVRVFGDTAVLNFILVESLDIGETVIGRYLNSCTLVKRDGRWQAVNWQSTPMQ